MNIPLVVATFAAIEKTLQLEDEGHTPELGFDMANWSEAGDCGTTACFAGWAAHLSGWELGALRHSNAAYCRKNGKPVYIEDVAGDLLGLDRDEYGVRVSPFYLGTLDGVYSWFADYLDVPEATLRAAVDAQVRADALVDTIKGAS